MEMPYCSSPEIPYRPSRAALLLSLRSSEENSLSSTKDDIMKKQWTLTGHVRGISSLKFHPKGHLLCSGSADRNIFLWDIVKGEKVGKLPGHRLGVDDVAFSTDGRFLASGSDDESVKLWDLERLKCLRTMKGHKKCIFSCAWNVQGSLLVSGGEDGIVFYWDVRTGSHMRSVSCHFNPVSSLEFHRDSTILLSASTDGLCRIWDTSTGYCLKTLVEQSNPPVGHARFSPNGRYVLVSHMNGSIKLWDYLRAKSKKVFTGHVNDTYCIPAGFLQRNGETLIVAGSEDHKVYLWNINSRKIVQILSGHSDVVIATACHPSECCVASAGLEKDHTIRIWRAV